MPVIDKECPECGGNVHAESYIGERVRGNKAYKKLICIGQKGSPGGDGAFWINRGTGCGFRARKTWVPGRGFHEDAEDNHDDKFDAAPGETVFVNDDMKRWKEVYA
ncbi:MAG: hypothetical protein SVU32_04685 [Candidatus Nanohaloarchaea archaeon]|nr:hypothetical protein [Candidatus Nanohaloarchaea archaeon]